MSRIDPIRRDLRRLSRGLCCWQLVCGLLVLAGGLVWFSTIFALVDLLLYLGPGWCWAAFGLCAAALAGGVGWGVRVALQRLNEEGMAARLEAAGSWHSRLINAVQFARSTRTADREFAEMLLAEQEVSLARVRSRRLVPSHQWRYPLTLLGIGAGVTLLVAVCAPQAYSTSLRRLLMPMAGIRPYSLTRIEQVAPGDAVVVKGNPLQVKVAFAGKLPADAAVELQTERYPRRRLEMVPEPGARDEFGLSTPRLFTSGRYRIHGGDTRSERWYRIRVESLPALEQWTAIVSPPAYTAASPQT